MAMYLPSLKLTILGDKFLDRDGYFFIQILEGLIVYTLLLNQIFSIVSRQFPVESC